MIRLFLMLSVLGTVGLLIHYGLSGMNEDIEPVIACAVCSAVLYIIDRLKNKWVDRLFIVLLWIMVLFDSYVLFMLSGYGMNTMRDMMTIVVLNGVVFALTYWSKKLDSFLGRK